MSSFGFRVSSFRFRVSSFLLVLLMAVSCQRGYVPKPLSYFRIDFPEKEYRMYDGDCPFTFEYPVYGTLSKDTHGSETCWYDIRFPNYRGTIHLTYKEIDNDFDRFIEDNWRIIFSGIAQRADGINDKHFENHEEKIYGAMFDISGNAASHVQFYLTDSVENFLRGSLYFTVRPNHDSLAPVVTFFRKDIIHLIETFRWKEVKK